MIPRKDDDTDGISFSDRRDVEMGRSHGLKSMSAEMIQQAQRMGSISGINNDNNKSYRQVKADFICEMRCLAKLRHPCITTVMGAVVSRFEEPMLVMEYMSYGSLYDVLRDPSIGFEIDVMSILQDVAQGLRFLHSSNPQVIHGDLKSQNVLIDSSFRAKVTDFGLSAKRQIGASGTVSLLRDSFLEY